MNRADYIDEAKRQLEDTIEDENGKKMSYYKKNKESEVTKQFREVEKILKEGVEQNSLKNFCLKNHKQQKCTYYQKFIRSLKTYPKVDQLLQVMVMAVLQKEFHGFATILPKMRLKI